MDDSKTFQIYTKYAGGGVPDSISPVVGENDKNRRITYQGPNQNLFTPCANQDGNPELSVTPEVPNADSVEIASELPQICTHDKDDVKTSSHDKDEGKKKTASERQLDEHSEQHLAPELPEITTSFPTGSSQRVEESWDFLEMIRSPRHGRSIDSSGSPDPSIYHDALRDSEELWILKGENPIEVGLGINLGNEHDKGMIKLQNNIPARAQESNNKLQDEVEKCQEKVRMVDERLEAENQQKGAAWREEMEQQINREKVQLRQEFNSRIAQEVTKACKEQELHIKQLNRRNRNLQEEKQGQEMDIEAYRRTIASQEDDLVHANRRILELTQCLDKRNREIESLDKTAKEAISQAERRDEELEKAKQELDAIKKDVGYVLDSASESEISPGPTLRAWNSGKGKSRSKNTDLELKMVMKQLEEGKAVVASQSCEINLLKEEIVSLSKVHEEDETVIKNQKRRIHSLEGLSPRFLALSESFENLKEELDKLSKVEAHDKAIIKQQRNEIEELELKWAKFKEVQESLDAKQTDLNETMIMLERDEAIIKQQQRKIQELAIDKVKLEEMQNFLHAKQRDLLDTKAKLKEVQESRDAKKADLVESMVKLEHNESIIKQQQWEIDQLVIDKAKLKVMQRSLNTKQTDLEDKVMKLEQANNELQNLRRLDQEKLDTSPEKCSESGKRRPALIDRPLPLERKARSRFWYPYRQNQLPQNGEGPHALAVPTTSNKNVSSFQAIGSLKGKNKSEASQDDDFNYADDGEDFESLERLFEMAVAGGAAILRNLELRGL